MSKTASCFAAITLFAVALGAQTTPSGVSLTTVHTVLTASIPGGITFDITGTTLYVNDISSGAIRALPVLRNPVTNSITGFGPPTTYVATATSVDGGLDFDLNGDLFWTTWPSHNLGQQTTLGATAIAPLAASGVPSSTGGLDIVPYFMPNFGDVLVSSYTAGGIYKITITPSALGNGTYDVVPGSATLFAATPTGIEGLTHIPAGPYMGDILYVSYSQGTITLLHTDPSTGLATGQSETIISGLSVPMDVAFDPVTNDFFVTTYSSSNHLYQFTGTLVGDYQTNSAVASLDVNGVQASLTAPAVTTVPFGQPVTVNWQSTLSGYPFDIVVTGTPLLPANYISPNGQIVNVDFVSGYFFAFGGFGASFFPQSVNVTLPPGTFSAQMAILDPSAPDGFHLSQAVQIDVLPCSYFENIDTTPLGVNSYPTGWSNGGGTHAWTCATGATSSLSTGPDSGHGGTGRYMYCETSITGIGTFIMNVGSHAVVPGDKADFWAHMYGATTGSLELEEEIAPGVWTPIWSLAGDQGNQWFRVQTTLIGAGGVANLRFRYVSGGSFTGDAAIDDFGICQ